MTIEIPTDHTLTVAELVRELIDRAGTSGKELHAFIGQQSLEGVGTWRAWDNAQQHTTHVELVVERIDLDALASITGPLKTTPLSAGVCVDVPGFTISISFEYEGRRLHLLYRKVAPKDTRDPAPLLALIRETLPKLVEHPTLLANTDEWKQQRESCERALAAARELLTFRDVPYAITSWAGHYYGLLAGRADRFHADAPRHGLHPEPEVARSAVSQLFERHRRQNAEDLVVAERAAIAKGTEPWDLARFESLLNRGPQANRELDHMRQYYGVFTTLADYARHLLEMEPWEDAR